jgi:hypothetical protein
MREICQSGSEGGVARMRHPYPYRSPRFARGAGLVTIREVRLFWESCRFGNRRHSRFGNLR